MLSAPVLNPPIPFVGPITGGLHPGKTITIYGHVPANASRFHINFTKCANSALRPDIPLHMNVRYDENCVVRNTFLRGSWGIEERDPPYIPMARGQSFELMCLVEQNSYKVAINGRHFTEYAHRDSFTAVTTLAIDGTVHINRIEYRENVQFPPVPYGLHQSSGTQVWPPGPISPVPLGGHKMQPVYNPALPFTYPIHGGLQVGTNIYISGRPSLNPYRFAIDFKCGTSDSSDIAMHINPRFDQNAVVRNSRLRSSWGSEERHGPLNFQGGITFDMCIQVQQNAFSIFLNGMPSFSFSHRVLPISRIKALDISGDVHISSIQFK